MAKAIVTATADTFGFEPDVITRKNGPRRKDIVYARLAATYLLRKLTSLSVYRIGDLLDGLDHGRVSHRYQEWEQLLKITPSKLNPEQHRAISLFKILYATFRKLNNMQIGSYGRNEDDN
jgi:chromosomal replication initiation ATPase DnaA